MEDPTISSITINGAKLHAQAFGPENGTLIIVLHGGPGAYFQYLLNVSSLADKGYRVVFYDQIGSGLSQRFPYAYYSKFGKDAVDKVFYDELNGVIKYFKKRIDQKVVLLGDSWGGIMAAGFVGKYPNAVDGIIVGEPGGLTWADISEYITESQAFKFFGETLNDVTFADQFITAKNDEHEVLDYKFGLISAKNNIVGERVPDIGNLKVHYRNGRVGSVIQSAMFELGEKYNIDFSEGLDQFQNKTLYIYSSENTVHNDEWAKKISSSFKNKEIFKVQGVGHSGYFDQQKTWKIITEPKVLEFLKSI
jgi:proline iminopeptidase